MLTLVIFIVCLIAAIVTGIAARTPGRHKKELRKAFISLSVCSVMSGGFVASDFLSDDKHTSRYADNDVSAAPTPMSESDCRKSVSCWAERHTIKAALPCAKAVERTARFEFEWQDSFLAPGPSFARARWHDQAAGTIDLTGDNLKMQNGFGAWQNVVFTCRYHALLRSVLTVETHPGRL